MEFFSSAHQVLQVLTPQPCGRPRSAAQAIRRSIVVAAIGLRNITHPWRIAPIAALVAATTLSLTLSRCLLETSQQTADHIGRLPFIILQVIYTLAFLALSSSLWRKVRPLF